MEIQRKSKFIVKLSGEEMFIIEKALKLAEEVHSHMASDVWSSGNQEVLAKDMLHKIELCLAQLDWRG